MMRSFLSALVLVPAVLALDKVNTSTSYLKKEVGEQVSLQRQLGYTVPTGFTYDLVYAGCLSLSAHAHFDDLDLFIMSKDDKSDTAATNLLNMDHTLCAAFCQYHDPDVRRVGFFHGEQCVCLKNDINYSKVTRTDEESGQKKNQFYTRPNEECDMPCPGHESSLCGGRERMAIYWIPENWLSTRPPICKQEPGSHGCITPIENCAYVCWTYQCSFFNGLFDCITGHNGVKCSHFQDCDYDHWDKVIYSRRN